MLSVPSWGIPRANCHSHFLPCLGYESLINGSHQETCLFWNSLTVLTKFLSAIPGAFPAAVLFTQFVPILQLSSNTSLWYFAFALMWFPSCWLETNVPIYLDYFEICCCLPTQTPWLQLLPAWWHIWMLFWFLCDIPHFVASIISTPVLRQAVELCGAQGRALFAANTVTDLSRECYSELHICLWDNFTHCRFLVVHETFFQRARKHWVLLCCCLSCCTSGSSTAKC